MLRTLGVLTTATALFAGALTGASVAGAAEAGTLVPADDSGGIVLTGETSVRPGGKVTVVLPAGVGVDTSSAVFDDHQGSNPPATVKSLGGRTVVVTMPTGLQHSSGTLLIGVTRTTVWKHWDVSPEIAIDVAVSQAAPATSTTRITASAFTTVPRTAPIPGTPLTLTLPTGNASLDELGDVSLADGEAYFGPLYSDRSSLTLETGSLAVEPATDGRSLALTVPKAYPLARYPANELAPYLVLTGKGTGDVAEVVFYAETKYTRATGAKVGLARRDRNGVMTFTLPTQILDASGPKTVVDFGLRDDIPLVGDWDGDGVSTVGVYRPSARTFTLASANRNGGGRLTSVKFGAAGDVPVVGRFVAGSEADVVGLYRPSTSTFYLGSANRDGGGKVRVVRFGKAGDRPVVGNWNGAKDGVARVGLFRPSTGKFLLASANVDGGGTTRTVTFAHRSDTPLAGDWDGDGRDDVGVYRPSIASFLLATETTARTPSISGLHLGRPTDTPLASTP